MTRRRPTYWDYIRVEELLSLQGGLEGDENALGDDEVRFLVIHQVDELWFKLALREIAGARDLFRKEPVPESEVASAVAALRRVRILFELAADHFRLMETMRTQDYLRFRDKLSPASGFQSAQMREIEILLGLEDDQRLAFGEEDSYLRALEGPDGNSPALERVRRRLRDRPTLKEAVYAWLGRTPIRGSYPKDPGDEEVVAGFVEDFLACHEAAVGDQIRSAAAVQALTPADEQRLRERYTREIAGARAFLRGEDVKDDRERVRVRRLRAAILFLESYRRLPLLSWPAEVVDGLLAAEQALLIFRQRHARMVERVIGRRVGTGGSEGVAYLDETALRYRVFRELWAARTLILPPERTPELREREFYGLLAE